MNQITKTINERYTHKALTVLQPFASNITKGSRLIPISKYIDYKGPLVVCSDNKICPRYSFLKNQKLSKAICYVDVIDCVKISDLTSKSWRDLSGLSVSDKVYLRHYYALTISFNSMILPIVVKPQTGLFDLILNSNACFYDISIPEKKNNKKIIMLCSAIFLWFAFIFWMLYVLFGPPKIF